MRILVGLGHRDRVGKSTAATILRDLLAERGFDTSIATLAGPLKKYCHELFGHLGLKGEMFYERNPKLKDVPLACGKTPRDIWIAVGDGMRAIDPHIWRNKWYESEPLAEVVIAPDIRKINEASFIHENGGLLIEVDNPRVIETAGKSFSELGGWSKWNSMVINEGSVDELREKLVPVADQIAGLASVAR